LCKTHGLVMVTVADLARCRMGTEEQSHMIRNVSVIYT
jgi:hypothetical protein